MAELVNDDRSPRAIRLGRIAALLRVAAGVLGWLAVFLALAGLLGGITGGDLFDLLSRLIAGYDGAADTALLVMILLILANLSAFLVLMIGVGAGEFWSPPVLAGLLAVNVALVLWLGFIPALIPIGFAAYALALMAGDIGAFRVNPLMLKEVRERMRGARSFVVMTVYLGLMSAFAVIIYLIETQSGSAVGTSVTGELGRNLFRGVVGLQLFLIVFIAPAFTAGAVSSERERKTYDLLQVTLLPHQSFIIGKLESALAYILLLLLAAVPLQSIAFLFGGVTELELLTALAVLAVTAITFGTIGLYFSTTLDRTLTASTRAYIAIFMLTIAVPMVIIVVTSVFRQFFVTAVGSSAVLQAGIIYLRGFAESLNPAIVLLQTQDLLISNRGSMGFYTEPIFDGVLLTGVPLPSPWLALTITYLLISAVMIVLSVRGLRDRDA